MKRHDRKPREIAAHIVEEYGVCIFARLRRTPRHAGMNVQHDAELLAFLIEWPQLRIVDLGIFSAQVFEYLCLLFLYPVLELPDAVLHALELDGRHIGLIHEAVRVRFHDPGHFPVRAKPARIAAGIHARLGQQAGNVHAVLVHGAQDIRWVRVLLSLPLLQAFVSLCHDRGMGA